MTAYPRITSEQQISAPPTRVADFESSSAAALPEAIFAPKSDLYVRIVKPALDRLAAACLLLVLSPVIVLASLAVVLTSGWPPWYRSKRVGLNGREFWMVKIRTMRRDADAVLSGEVTAFGPMVLREDRQDRVTEYQLAMTVRFELKDVRRARVLSARPQVIRRAEYVITRGETQQDAREEVIRELARKVVSIAFESWD